MRTIREASLPDLKLLMEWRMRVLAEVFAGEQADWDALYQANVSYYRRHLADGSHIACFVEENGNIIGCGGLCLYQEMPSPDNPDGRCAYLMNIFTLPPFRKMGAGRFLAGYLIEKAKEQGAGKIYLETSQAGRVLYEKLGFTDMHDYMHLV